MQEVAFPEEHEAVSHMIREFECWPFQEDPEYFLREMQKMHKQWILTRYPRFQEPKEKWRYLVATFERELSRIRETRQEEMVERGMRAWGRSGVALCPEVSRMIEEHNVFESKLRYFREAQQKEQGETNFKVFEGLGPGEEFEPLVAKMRENYMAKVKAVLSE